MKRLAASLLAMTMAGASFLVVGANANADVRQPAQACTVTANTVAKKSHGADTNLWGSVSNCAPGVLLAQANIDGAWVNVGSTNVSGSGQYSIKLGGPLLDEGSYQVRAVLGSTQSTISNFERIGAPSAASAGTAPTGVVSNVWGTFPGGATSVWTEVLTPDGWSTSQRGTTNSSGGYVLPLTFGQNSAGSYQYRVAGRYPDGTIVRTAQFTFERVARPTASSAGSTSIGVTSNAWGTFVGAPNIEVWTEAWTPTGWSTSAKGRTDSKGYYVLPLTYGQNSIGTHKFRIAGRQSNGTVVRSGEFTLKRTAPTPTASSAGSAPSGQTANAWGTFVGGNGISVWTEVWTPGGWSTSATGRTKSDGSYVLPLTYGQNSAGSYKFRVAGRYPDGTVVRSGEFTFQRTQHKLDPRCLTGRVMCASKTTNKMHWVVNGKILATVDVRYGRPGLETREGTFNVFRKSRHHVSSIYGTAMPWSMFFSGGQAVHYSADFARRGWNGGSAGCINVRDAATLDWIYSQVRIGDKVVVHW